MSDSEDEVAERQFKMVLIGDPQVGKTSMVTRYAKEMFTKQGPHSIEKSLTWKPGEPPFEVFLLQIPYTKEMYVSG